MNRQKGFTLLELLVVIAIIAILAAITFPVFARAKEQAYRSSDTTNMNAIRTALSLYKADQGAMPPAILGYATGYYDDGRQGNPAVSATNIVPADKVAGALFPKRIESSATLKPANVRSSGGLLENEFTTAVWPAIGPEAGGTDANRLQRFGPADQVQRCDRSESLAGVAMPAYFYRLSGYDAADVQTAGGRTELRYTLFWSRYAISDDPCQTDGGSSNDNPRQLGYADPPDSTVVTWNSYFRDYQDGQPTRTRKDIVLFLGGSARPADSRAVSDLSYQVTP